MILFIWKPFKYLHNLLAKFTTYHVLQIIACYINGGAGWQQQSVAW